jgi:acetyl esterase
MPLHPQAKELIDQISALAPLETLSVPEARVRSEEMMKRLGPGEPVAGLRERAIPGPGGEIPVRFYVPGGKGPFPAMVFFHGGGWVVGSLETTDFYCRALTNGTGCLVASVNYRHGPEHRFPAAADDAYAATKWIAANAASVDIDPARLVVGGSSAGGNLAAVAAIMARERGGPEIRAQVLSVPVMDFNFETKSYRDNADGYGLTRAAMQWFWKHYLKSDGDGADPRASPLREKNLRGLPPAFISTAEFDPLRDEGAAYARRLRDAGVPVEHRDYAGMVHMFLGPDSIPDIARFLHKAFAL